MGQEGALEGDIHGHLLAYQLANSVKGAFCFFNVSPGQAQAPLGGEVDGVLLDVESPQALREGQQLFGPLQIASPGGLNGQVRLGIEVVGVARAPNVRAALYRAWPSRLPR